MVKLYKKGWNNREITNFLNIFGRKKRNTKTDYMIKDVFMCLKKLKLRGKDINKFHRYLEENKIQNLITQNIINE